ncbi:ORF V: Enzymatic polyprotein [Labeo rohita]|uniref:ORF V: Enzymatic polyprotein n=1 Tax=Labeo rohita TaxID=84645 RepID=A0ABQ8MUJ7_LABRO|nr:ORF V: Enzymatic polyprotein [Labeo rohita]
MAAPAVGCTAFHGVRLSSGDHYAHPAGVPGCSGLRRAHTSVSSTRQRSEGRSLTVKQFQQLLGLMAAASNVIPFGLLYMRPLQWWLRTKGFSPRGNPFRMIKVMQRCLRALDMWKKPGVRSSLSPRNGSDGCVSHRLGCGHEWPPRPRSVEQSPSHLAHQLPGDAGRVSSLKHFLPDLIGCHVLVHTDNTAVVYYINHQGGLRSHPLYKLAHQILVWSQDKLLSLRAVHVPGHLNMGADILSRQRPRPREWMLHPEVVKQIWRVFGQAQVDLFATQENAQCPHWYSLTHPAPLGLDAMVQNVAKASSPRTGVWFSDLISLLDGSPWEIPVRRDLLSQAGGTILHPRTELWKLWAWPLRAAGLAHSTLRVYVAAISAYHAPLGGMSVCKDPLVVHFLCGALRLRPPIRHRVPTWDLAVVLEALCRPPFEPIEESSDHHLSIKTVLLLALTSLKRVGDLQALSVAPSHLEFAPGMAKAFLYPRPGNVPKVLSSAPWPIVLQAFCPPPFRDPDQQKLNCMCPDTSTELPCGEKLTICLSVMAPLRGVSLLPSIPLAAGLWMLSLRLMSSPTFPLLWGLRPILPEASPPPKLSCLVSLCRTSVIFQSWDSVMWLQMSLTVRALTHQAGLQGLQLSIITEVTENFRFCHTRLFFKVLYDLSECCVDLEVWSFTECFFTEWTVAILTLVPALVQAALTEAVSTWSADWIGEHIQTH